MHFTRVTLCLVAMLIIGSGAAFAQHHTQTTHQKPVSQKHHKPGVLNTEHHNHYELEVSMNDGLHSEITGSVYFLPKKKIQVTAEDSFHHYTMVLVQELPFRNSHWGTFAGFGTTYGIEKHGDLHHDVHQEHTDNVTEHNWSAIVQSGLAYSLDKHWSTGFTVSPGWDFHHHKVIAGATLDLVYGF